MLTTDESNVTHTYVIPSANWKENCRWTMQACIDSAVMTADAEDGTEEEFDFERLFTDEENFVVHAFCKYTDELEFTHGVHVYAWEVYLESMENPGICYYCESMYLEERDNDAEMYEIFRIADAHVSEVEAIAREASAEKCPHADEPYHDEINDFLNVFLFDFFSEN